MIRLFIPHGLAAGAELALDPGQSRYLSAVMRQAVNDEVLLFKFFDSDHSVTWRCPHTAFWDTSLPDPHTRESIEFRSLAFFE